MCLHLLVLEKLLLDERTFWENTLLYEHFRRTFISPEYNSFTGYDPNGNHFNSLTSLLN